MIDIKVLTQDYYDDCLRVIASAYADEFDELKAYFDKEFPSAFVTDDNVLVKYTFCGVFVDKLLIGFGAYAPSSISSSVWELAWGTMHKDHQGKGHGHKLLDFRMSEIKKISKTPSTFVMVDSTPTRLFLENGFEIGFPRDNKAVMWKKL